MKIRLPFALQNDKLVHISEVESGLKCNCICPHCHSRLIARKGKKNIEHFAHYDLEECDKGFETALHLASKEILMRYRRIVLPKFIVNINNREHIILDHEVVVFDHIILEKTIEDIKADAVGIYDNKKIIIEFAATHFIDEYKRNKLNKIGIPVIEIDMSYLLKSDTKFNDIEMGVVGNLENRYWIFNDNAEREINRIKEEYRIEADRIKREHYETEKFYEKYYKKVREVKLKKRRWFGEYTDQVDNCGLKKREYHDYKGKYFANTIRDCENCEYYEGHREDGKNIICLFDYKNNKEN